MNSPGLLPDVRMAVTTPGTSVTESPSSGETNDVPWMSWIRAGPGSGAGQGGGPLTGLAAPGVGSWTVKLESVAGAAVRPAAVVLDRAGAAPPSAIAAVP